MGWVPGGGGYTRVQTSCLSCSLFEGLAPLLLALTSLPLFDCKNCTQCFVLISCHLEDPAFHLLFTRFLYSSRLFLSSFLPVRSPLPAPVPVPPTLFVVRRRKDESFVYFPKDAKHLLKSEENIAKRTNPKKRSDVSFDPFTPRVTYGDIRCF